MAVRAAAVTPNRADRQPLTPAGFTIQDAIGSYERFLASPLSGNRSPVTVATYVGHLRKLTRFMAERGMPQDVALVRREHIEAYFQHLSTAVMSRRGELGVRPATLSVAFRSIRPFWKWLIDEGEIRESPMARMTQPTVPEDHKRVVTGDEVQALLATCATGTFEDTRDAAIIGLLFSRGLRRGELAGLGLDDVDMRHQRILINSATSKSKRAREIGFASEQARLLDRYLRRRARHPNAHLPALWLQSRRGHGWTQATRQTDRTAPEGGITGNGILQMLRRRAKQAGLANVYTHAFRHGFVHAAYVAEMPEDAIMRTTGHTDVNMIRRVYGARYANERAIAKADEHDPLDALLRRRRDASRAVHT